MSAAGGFAVVAGSIAVGLAFGLVDAPLSRAQNPADIPAPWTRLAFEVVSVKAIKVTDPRDIRGPQFTPAGRFTSNISLIAVIAAAYHLPLNPKLRLSGGPDWIRTSDGIYEIEATTARDSIPDGLSRKARQDRLESMLRALLADRFKLVIHRETIEMPIYALVIAKGGPKLQTTDLEEKNCPDIPASFNAPLGEPVVGCHVFMGGQGRGLHARAADMADLVRYVENWTDRPLIDKTGIKGIYHIDTKGWLPMQLGPPPAAGAKAEDGSDMTDVPTLFDVLGGLGLKIESQKGDVDVYVIDHIEKPSEN